MDVGNSICLIMIFCTICTWFSSEIQRLPFQSSLLSRLCTLFPRLRSIYRIFFERQRPFKLPITDLTHQPVAHMLFLGHPKKRGGRDKGVTCCLSCPVLFFTDWCQLPTHRCDKISSPSAHACSFKPLVLIHKLKKNSS